MKESSRGRPGPDPERLKLPFRDWRKAVREALKRERPPEGWPDDQDEREDAEDRKDD
jgi:hypothetical protein